MVTGPESAPAAPAQPPADPPAEPPKPTDAQAAQGVPPTAPPQEAKPQGGVGTQTPDDKLAAAGTTDRGMQDYKASYFQDGFRASGPRKTNLDLQGGGGNPPEGLMPPGYTPAPAPAPTPTTNQTAPAAKAQAPTPDDYDPGKAQDKAEAARRIADQDSPRYASGNEARRGDDLVALSQARPPDWTAAAYEKMGPELSAQTLGDAMTGIRANDTSDPDIQAAKVQSLADGVGQMTPARQAELARASAASDKSTWAMGQVLERQGPSDQARGAFVDANWEKAKAGDHFASSAISSRAIGDVLAAGDPSLLDEKLRTDPAGMGQVVANGLEVGPGAASGGSTALESHGLERVVGMTANYQGEDAAVAKALVLRGAGTALGGRSDPSTQPLVKEMADLYTSDRRGITEALYQNDGPVAGPAFDKGGNTLPRLMRDAVFNGQAGDDFPEKLGTKIDEMRTQDPYRLGILVNTLDEGFDLAMKESESNGTAIEKGVKTLGSIAMAMLPKAAGTLLSEAQKQVQSQFNELAAKAVGARSQQERQEALKAASAALDQRARPPQATQADLLFTAGRGLPRDKPDHRP